MYRMMDRFWFPFRGMHWLSAAEHLNWKPIQSAAKILFSSNWADDPNTVLEVKNGEIGGLLYARDTVIENQLADLNNTVVSLVSRVNAIHRTGYDLNNTTGVDFFVYSDATAAQPIPNIPALSVKINSAIADNTYIAAATQTNAAGDGNNALAIANCVNTLVTGLTDAEDPVAASGEDSILHYNTSRITSLALEQRHAITGASDTGNIMTAMDEQREAVAGVNLDEEAANMVKYQRAYQAAARLMNTFDEMIELVVTNLGLVGR